MKNLEIGDLYNPEKIKAVLLKNEDFVEAGIDQGFQAYYNKKNAVGDPLITSLELWQKMGDGRLMKVTAWRRTSIIATY